MLRRVRHLGRKASKYRFVVSLNQLTVKGTKSWQPHKLVVVLSRRKRKFNGSAQSWRPSIEDPYKGSATWSGLNQQVLEFVVTLFESQTFTGFEPKNWVFAIENEARDGKRKPIATVRVDMAQYVTTVPTPNDIELVLKPLTGKVNSSRLTCSITCNFLSAGPATDADLVSLAGSTASEDTIRLGDIDVGNLHDLDFESSLGNPFGEESNENSLINQQELRNLTNQIESLNFALDDQEASPFQTPPQPTATLNNESGSEKSRRSSIRSAISDQSSVNLSSQTPSKGCKTNEVENADNNLLNESDRRNSFTSDSSDNSFQKRRLRPSADYLPVAHNECEISGASTLSSPAPKSQKSLLRWCQRATTGYEGVKVTNFTTSWRNGLALCALLHNYKPEFVNYESLNAFEGRKNVKKAMEGFMKLEATSHCDLPSFSVSNKSNLIEFLMALRSFFKEDESPHESTDETSSSDSRSSLPRMQHTGPRNIRGSTRVKLLSDLQEKEMEDDVFSAALDLALEEEKSPKSENLTEKTAVFSSEQFSVVRNPGDGKEDVLQALTESLSNSTNSYVNSTVTEATLEKSSNSSSAKLPCDFHRKSNSSSPKIMEKDTETTSTICSEADNDVVPLDIVLNSLDNDSAKTIEKETSSIAPKETTLDSKTSSTVLEKDQNSHEIKLKNPFEEVVLEEEQNKETLPTPETKEKSPRVAPNAKNLFEKQPATVKKSAEHETGPETVENFLTELELENPFDDLSSSLQTNSKVGEAANLPEIILKNPFEEAESLTTENNNFSNITNEKGTELHSNDHNSTKIDTGFSTQNENPRKEIDLNVSIHLLSSSEKVLEDKISPGPEPYLDVVEAKSDRSENEEESNSFAKTEKNSTLDVAIKLSPSNNSTSKEGDQDFQNAVQKLLKSSAERTRKAKALEIIAQTKADMTSSKVVTLSEQELKRQELVKERAQKLIEETRARLHREKQEAMLETESKGDVNKVSIDKTNHNLSPIKILSVLPCDTSTPKEQHLTGNERTRTVVASSDPYHKTDFHDQNRELKLTKVEEMDRNQESIPQKLSVQDTPLSSSNVLVPQTLKVESHTNSISSNSSQLPAAITATSDQTKNADLNKASIPQPIKENHFVTKPEEKKTFTDPLSTMSAASPALVPSSSSSSASEISHPLASTFDRTSNHIKEDDIVKGPSSVNGDVFVDPLSVHGVEKVSLKDDTDTARKSSNVSADFSSSTSIGRISDAEEVEKRWSSMVKKSTSSATTSEMNEIEAEKKALEAEQRLVDERANEVRYEIQELKNAGGRANKRREADLTQEWFQLVNKKNAILRQQDQLGLREEEQIILNQVEKLNDELIPLLQSDESMKTDAQRERETKLLEEKVRLVNERDKIVQLMNEKEQSALDEEERIQTNISENVSQMMRQDEKCLIM